MKSRIEFEVSTLCIALKAGAEALEEIKKSPEGLTKYGEGALDVYNHVVRSLERILKEVSE